MIKYLIAILLPLQIFCCDCNRFSIVKERKSQYSDDTIYIVHDGLYDIYYRFLLSDQMWLPNEVRSDLFNLIIWTTPQGLQYGGYDWLWYDLNNIKR